MLRRPFKVLAVTLLAVNMILTSVITSASTIDSNSETEAIIEPEIVATTAVVFDANTSAVLYDKNKDQEMYPASITKILTALIAIEAFDRDDEIQFSQEAVTQLRYNSSSIGARPEEILSLDQTLHAMLLMSANEAAIALAEARSGSVEGFSIEMNNQAQALGAINSNFTNPHGLFDEEHYTTAYDMALITSIAIESPYFLEIMSHSTYEIEPTNKCDETRYLAQKHKMLSDRRDMRIYREDVIAGKQGYITESGHTLVTVADNGERKLIVVILGSDANNLYTDTEKLIEYGYLAQPIIEVVEKVIDENTDEGSDTTNLDYAGKSTLLVKASEIVESDGKPMVDKSISDEGQSVKDSKGRKTIVNILMWLIIGVVAVGAILIFDQRLSRLRRVKRSQRKRI